MTMFKLKSPIGGVTRLMSVGLLFVGLWCLGANNTLAGSPPPPAPSPKPIIPLIDPIPGTPSLSIELSQTGINLNWNVTQDAEYYPVYVYAGFGNADAFNAATWEVIQSASNGCTHHQPCRKVAEPYTDWVLETDSTPVYSMSGCAPCPFFFLICTRSLSIPTK